MITALIVNHWCRLLIALTAITNHILGLHTSGKRRIRHAMMMMTMMMMMLMMTMKMMEMMIKMLIVVVMKEKMMIVW